MDLRIRKKVAVVAAASKGLGRAVAEALAKEGANLAICSRNKKQINETANYIRTEYKVEVIPFVCDVTNPSEICSFKESVISRFNTCHILFTNAGGPPAGNIKDFTADDFKKAIDLNLISTINLVYAFLPLMQKQKWGRILASTSSNVRQQLPEFPLSNVSRVAVLAFIKTLAQEIAHSNITANVLAPGYFMTNPTREYIEKQAKNEGIEYIEVLRRIEKTIPTHTVGNPEDFGALTAFLSSEYASYITGETFLIDGGAYSSVM